MIDLHSHTTASDGQYSPTELVKKASEHNIKLLAITDHDTINGLEEAKNAGEQYGIKIIPGIEINITAPRGEFHLLGLGITDISPSMKEILNNVIKTRHQRNEEMIQKMKEAGVSITYEEMLDRFPNTMIGRPHFAAILQEKKIVKNRQQAFDLYLAKGRPWYIERIGTNLDEAIIAIKESKGLPVIAHPMSLYLSWGKLPEMLEKFYEQGACGIEAFHPGARVTECLRLEELGRKIGFFITAGSDFHGEKIRPDRRLGHTCGGKKIDNKFWNEELGPILSKENNSFNNINI
ncbi:MAG: PHP domain-containing protein [Candidatus Riflebacteria bacterium]|nr:PHP domain-containing protein [Candidatus Riflebacteria bacterium]